MSQLQRNIARILANQIYAQRDRERVDRVGTVVVSLVSYFSNPVLIILCPVSGLSYFITLRS